MEELKTAATHARDANDLNALHNIGQQIEMIQNRQALLLREQHQERQFRARLDFYVKPTKIFVKMISRKKNPERQNGAARVYKIIFFRQNSNTS